jgi:hypothetical protein
MCLYDTVSNKRPRKWQYVAWQTHHDNALGAFHPIYTAVFSQTPHSTWASTPVLSGDGTM